MQGKLQSWTIGASPCPEATGPQMHVLSGSMTITPDGGEPEFVGPGDTVFIPRGWSGNWELHQTLRKLHVIF